MLPPQRLSDWLSPPTPLQMNRQAAQIELHKSQRPNTFGRRRTCNSSVQCNLLTYYVRSISFVTIQNHPSSCINRNQDKNKSKSTRWVHANSSRLQRLSMQSLICSRWVTSVPTIGKKEERSKIQLFSPHNAVETQLLTMKIFSFKNDDLP